MPRITMDPEKRLVGARTSLSKIMLSNSGTHDQLAIIGERLQSFLFSLKQVMYLLSFVAISSHLSWAFTCLLDLRVAIVLMQTFKFRWFDTRFQICYLGFCTTWPSLSSNAISVYAGGKLRGVRIAPSYQTSDFERFEMPYRFGRILYLCVGASRSSITSPFPIVNYSFTHSDIRVSCSEVVPHQYLLRRLSSLVRVSRNPRTSIAVSQAKKPNDRTRRDSTILGHGGSTGQRQRGRRKDSASEHTVCRTPLSLFS